MKKTNRKKRSGPTIVLAAILVLGLGGLGAWHFLYRDIEPSNPAPSALEVIEPVEGVVSVAIDAPALIEPYRERTIRSVAAGSIVYRAAAGTVVAADEVIVALDPGDLQVQLDRARLDLEEAEISRRRAERTLDRAERDLADTERLHAAGGVSREQLENSREAVASAELGLQSAILSVRKAEISLANAEADLAGAQIRAPWDGVILSTDVDEGDMVGSNTALLTLADLKRVRAISEIDEFDVARVRAGLTVNVRAEAIAGTGAGPFTSVVELVSPAAKVVSNISVFTVSTVLDNPDTVLRPGMSADLTISIARDEGLVIPARAITTVRNRSYVDIVPRDESGGNDSEDGVAPEFETVRIEIGTSDGVNTVVLDGLYSSDRVVMPAAAAAFALPAAATTPGGDTNSIVPVPIPGAGGSPGSSPSGGLGGGGGGGGGGR